VATVLGLSFKTIETHRENIKHKLGLQGANQLVHFATEWARQQVSSSQPQKDVAERLTGGVPRMKEA
jgi:hypothetical protein